MSIRKRLLVIVVCFWALGLAVPVALHHDFEQAQARHIDLDQAARSVLAANRVFDELGTLIEHQEAYRDFQTLIVPSPSLHFSEAMAVLGTAFPREIERLQQGLTGVYARAGGANGQGYEARQQARAEISQRLADLHASAADLRDRAQSGVPEPVIATPLPPLTLHVLFVQCALGAVLVAALYLLVVMPWNEVFRATLGLAAGDASTPIRTNGKRELGMVQRALVQLRGALFRLEQLAFTDELTALANRRRCEQWLDEFVSRERPGNILLIDIDHLNRVNMGLGSRVGDLCLREVADRIRAVTGASDLAGRYDGDSFLVISPQASDQATPHPDALGKAIVEAVERPYIRCGHRIHLSVSVGIANAPCHGRDAFHLLGAAHTALGDAKRGGGGNARVARSAFKGQPDEMFRRLSELDSGLDRQEFEAHVQPVVDTRTGTVVCGEALARWRHAERGILMPGEFLPAAQAGGKMTVLSNQVFASACKHLKILHLAGVKVPLAFNLSACELRSEHLRQLLQTFEASELPAGLIEFEITESSLIDNLSAVQPVIDDLRKRGFRIALDDFGTGYSSLTHLQRLPIDKIKIDRSFVMRLDQERKSREIIAALSRLAQGLDLTVVAEGVEKASQRDMLSDLGCPVQQGFLFSPAIPTHAFLRFLHAPARNDMALESVAA